MVTKRAMVAASGSVALVLLMSEVALAQESGSGGEWQGTVGTLLAAALAIGLSALAAGYAQGKIGSAAAGTLAERPEERIWVITMVVLPEIIVLLGFVTALMIINK